MAQVPGSETVSAKLQLLIGTVTLRVKTRSSVQVVSWVVKEEAR